MNILKKLKLALLATSVMFFPKGVRAMDEETKSDSTHISRSQSSTSTSIAGSSHDTELHERERMKNLFGVTFTPNKEIIDRLQSLGSETDNITKAIKTHLIEKFAPWLTRERDTFTRNDSEKRFRGSLYFNSLENLVSSALSLPKSEIILRSSALAEKIPELMEVYRAWRLHNAKPYDKQGDLIKDPVTLDSLIGSNKAPRVLSLVSSLLKFNPEQIKSRASAIVEAKDVLLPTEDHVIVAINSLMNFEPQEIVERSKIMGKLFSSLKEFPISTQADVMKLSTRNLNNEELNSRLNRGISASEKSDELKLITSELVALSLNQPPEVFNDYVHLLETNESVRTQLGKVHYLDIIFASSLEELHNKLNRMHNLGYYQLKFLPELRSTFKNPKGEVMPKNLLYIKMARDYPLLPNSSAPLNDFDTQVLKEKIEKYPNLKKLFKLPPSQNFSPLQRLKAVPRVVVALQAVSDLS